MPVRSVVIRHAILIKNDQSLKLHQTCQDDTFGCVTHYQHQTTHKQSAARPPDGLRKEWEWVERGKERVEKRKTDRRGARHDSVIYSHSERPARSVHWHALSVPANLSRRMLRTYGPASHSKHVGWVPCFKCMGQYPCIKWSGRCISIFGWLHQMDQNSSTGCILWVSGPANIQSMWASSCSKCVGWVPPFKCTGQWVSILAYGPVPLLQAV
jgi:hypothetical protein